LAAGEIRKQITAARSSGDTQSAGLFSGIAERLATVSITVGNTALTLMPFVLSSWARVSKT